LLGVRLYRARQKRYRAIGLKSPAQNPTFLEPGESGGQIKFEVPLIHVSPRETLPVSEDEVTLMDVGAEAVSEPATTDLADPMSTDGREVRLPLSTPQTDGSSELPGKKRRRVMFADE